MNNNIKDLLGAPADHVGASSIIDVAKGKYEIPKSVKDRLIKKARKK